MGGVDTSRTPSSHGDAVVMDNEPRCLRCHKKLAEYLARPWLIICVRCKASNVRETSRARPQSEVE